MDVQFNHMIVLLQETESRLIYCSIIEHSAN